MFVAFDDRSNGNITLKIHESSDQHLNTTLNGWVIRITNKTS